MPKTREPNRLHVDVGRFRIKQEIFDLNYQCLEYQGIQSIFVQTDTLQGDIEGAFTVGFKNTESGETEEQHWIVGEKATSYKGHFSFSDKSENKITFFGIGFLGALSQFTCLSSIAFESGGKQKKMSLKIAPYILSLADRDLLIENLAQYAWLKVDGIKYDLKFPKKANGAREGYGAAIYAYKKITRHPYKKALICDIGGGTMNQSEISFKGFRPKEGFSTPNGGGGVIPLAQKLIDVLESSDICKPLNILESLEVISKASWNESQIIAYLPDGTDCGELLEKALNTWAIDTAAKKGIARLIKSGKEIEIYMVGGGMKIKVLKQFLHQKMIEGGVPEENIIYPEDPHKINLSYIRFLDSKYERVVIDGQN